MNNNEIPEEVLKRIIKNKIMQDMNTEDKIMYLESINDKWRIKSKEEVMNAALSEDWERVARLGVSRWEIMDIAFNFLDKFPPTIQREFVLRCYAHHGDSLKCCREAVKSLEKRGKKELPEEYAESGEITVYRAGEEPKRLCNERLSWTLDIKVADFFYNKWSRRHASALYKAKIRPCDVIAYIDDREEHEVIQYNSVYDVEYFRL